MFPLFLPNIAMVSVPPRHFYNGGLLINIGGTEVQIRHCKKMLALMDVKRDEFLEELDVVDGRDLMDSEVTKWALMSEKVMNPGYSSHMCDGTACKGKWQLLLPNYRKVANYHTRTWIDFEDYWLLTTSEHVAEKLPRAFSKEVYVCLRNWFDHWN